MKYVDWVDRVLQAAAAYVDGNDEAAVRGMQVIQLPEALGYGEIAFSPGFTNSPMWEAIHDALKDLDDINLVDKSNRLIFKVTRSGLDAKDLSLSTGWHVIFDEIEPNEREMEFLRWLATNAVIEAEEFARTKWVMADEVFAGLGWAWDTAGAGRVIKGLLDLRCVRGLGYGGGNYRLHPTYIGIVRATEEPRFVRKPVSEGAAVCFISYAHEDVRLARDIAYGLQGADLGVEIDEEILAGGDSLIERIAEATQRVEFVIALVSRHSVDSRWCKFELALAMTDELAMPGVKVIPVRVGKVEMPPMLRAKFYRTAERGTETLIGDLVRDIGKHRARAVIEPE